MRLVTAAEEKVIDEDGFQTCRVVILHIVSITENYSSMQP